MKKKMNEWNTQEKFEGMFFLVAIALVIVGINNNFPLIIVGLSIFLLIFLGRYFGKDIDQNDH